MTDIRPINGPRIPPATGGAPEYLIVVLHGYGANGQDLIGLASYLHQAVPEAMIVAPDAPDAMDGAPPGYPGCQWFPITRLAPEEMWAGVQSAGPTVDAFIDAELAIHGLTSDKLILVGFSQGAMLSLHVGLRRATPPAGIIGFSGSLAGPEHLPSEVTGTPPVLLVHGDADDVVPVQALVLARQALGAANVPTQWHISQGTTHNIAPDGLEKAISFLSSLP